MTFDSDPRPLTAGWKLKTDSRVPYLRNSILRNWCYVGEVRVSEQVQSTLDSKTVIDPSLVRICKLIYVLCPAQDTTSRLSIHTSTKPPMP